MAKRIGDSSFIQYEADDFEPTIWLVTDGYPGPIVAVFMTEAEAKADIERRERRHWSCEPFKIVRPG